jgi:hypothetical protein
MLELGQTFYLFVVYATVWILGFFAWAVLSERRR